MKLPLPCQGHPIVSNIENTLDIGLRKHWPSKPCRQWRCSQFTSIGTWMLWCLPVNAILHSLVQWLITRTPASRRTVAEHTLLGSLCHCKIQYNRTRSRNTLFSSYGEVIEDVLSWCRELLKWHSIAQMLNYGPKCPRIQAISVFTIVGIKEFNMMHIQARSLAMFPSNGEGRHLAPAAELVCGLGKGPGVPLCRPHVHFDGTQQKLEPTAAMVTRPSSLAKVLPPPKEISLSSLSPFHTGFTMRAISISCLERKRETNDPQLLDHGQVQWQEGQRWNLNWMVKYYDNAETLRIADSSADQATTSMITFHYEHQVEHL